MKKLAFVLCSVLAVSAISVVAADSAARKAIFGDAPAFVQASKVPVNAAAMAGKRVVVAAHGNSIRALVKYLDNIGDDEIVGVNIPNGIPLVYELDENLKPIRHYYLGDAEAAAKAAAAVASQGKA